MQDTAKVPGKLRRGSRGGQARDRRVSGRSRLRPAEITVIAVAWAGVFVVMGRWLAPGEPCGTRRLYPGAP
jgi:hypothetical protein